MSSSSITQSHQHASHSGRTKSVQPTQNKYKTAPRDQQGLKSNTTVKSHTVTSICNESKRKPSDSSQKPMEIVSNAAKLARLGESVESFLEQVCETGAFQNQSNNGKDVDAVSHEQVNLNCFNDQEQSEIERQKIRNYEDEILALRKQCEKDKNEYLSALKATLERQDAMVMAVKEDFNKKQSVLKADLEMYIGENAKIKQELERQSLYKSHLDQMPIDFIKQYIDINSSPNYKITNDSYL